MRILFILCICLIACNSGNESKVTSFDSSGLSTDPVDTIPRNDKTLRVPTPLQNAVNSVITKKLSGEWLVMNDSLAQWPKDMFDYFIAGKRNSSPDYPYITVSDFDADLKPDTAALVIKKDMSIGKVAIITNSGKLVLWDDDARGAAISVQPRQKLGDIYDKFVNMRADGVNVEFFEKSSFVLYWNGKSFKKAWTGD